MKFGPLPLETAAGHILAHKLLDTDGNKLFSKGHHLTNADVNLLRQQGFTEIIVAALDSGDLLTKMRLRAVLGWRWPALVCASARRALGAPI